MTVPRLVRLVRQEVHNPVKFQSRRNQTSFDEIVECTLQCSPCRGQWAAASDVFGKSRVEDRQTWGKEASITLSEEHSDGSANGGELVSIGLLKSTD
jgi:hypothetical protein